MNAIKTPQISSTGASANLDGFPAKKFSIFSFDRMTLLIISSNYGYIYNINFDGDNPNDPDFDEHSETYSQILSTFKFTD